MTHRNIKIGLTVLVLLGAFTGLLYSSLGEGVQYYKHVDEVMTNPQQWQGKPLQLHGFVVAGSILKNPNTLEYRFKVENNGSVVDASYQGVVPDTFEKPGAEVVLRGTLTPQGFHTEPNGVMAKCPSKYQADKKVG